MEKQLFSEVDSYICSLFAAEDVVLNNVIRSLDRHQFPQASISPSQGRFLQVMARACNANRILELGTLGGYSTIWLARALGPGGKLISLEVDAEHAKLAAENVAAAGLSDKVDIRVGKALDLLKEMLNHKEAAFDLVFMDADKPPYTEYFQHCLRLSRPGTIVIADNVIRGGKVLDENSEDPAVLGVRRFNKYLSECPEVTASIFQNIGMKEHDGMAIAVVN